MVERIFTQALLSRLGRISFFLLAIGQIAAGWSWLPAVRPDVPKAIVYMTQNGLHITVWAALWMLSGVMILTAMMFRPKALFFKVAGVRYAYRYGDLAVLFTIGIWAAWGVAYLASWIISLFQGDFASTDFVWFLRFASWSMMSFCGWLFWVKIRKPIR